MTEILKIDGSSGEGGGQIIRTSLSLSIILEIPIEITNIRSNRPNPGLQPQHLAAVRLTADLFSAKVENLKLGAQSIRFFPSGGFDSSCYGIDIGTAGSIPLVLLTIIPAVALRGKHTNLRITGGTDVNASPTIDYIKYVVRPAYQRLGIKFSLEVERRGYYPKGGGIVSITIEPCAEVEPAEFLEPPCVDPKITSVCSGLPKHVADRQILSAISQLEKLGMSCSSCTSSLETSQSPGSSILVYSNSEFGSFIGGDSIGQRGKAAEIVGKEAAFRFIQVIENNSAVDPFLADMLVVPLSLANGRSRFVTPRASSHLITNLQLASKFTNRSFTAKSREESGEMIEINP